MLQSPMCFCVNVFFLNGIIRRFFQNNPLLYYSFVRQAINHQINWQTTSIIYFRSITCATYQHGGRMDKTLGLKAGRSGVRILGRGKCSVRTTAVDARVNYPFFTSYPYGFKLFVVTFKWRCKIYFKLKKFFLHC